MSRILLAGLLALAATPALAQQTAPSAAPAPSAGQVLGGVSPPGVCLLSQQAVFANAKVGVAASARIKQLSDQAQAEVNTDRAPIDADQKALDAQTKIKPADKAAKQQALNARLQVLQNKANLLSREIETTRQKALARISTEETPVIGQAYKAHNCGLLFDRNSVLGGNMSGDLTADVVKGLDARITTITFDRETLAK
jgi:Skp family chaperone for outer membrane proteins